MQNIKACALCVNLTTCEIDTSHIEDWDGTKDYCSRFVHFDDSIQIPDDCFISFADLNAQA